MLGGISFLGREVRRDSGFQRDFGPRNPSAPSLKSPRMLKRGLAFGVICAKHVQHCALHTPTGFVFELPSSQKATGNNDEPEPYDFLRFFPGE